MSFWGEASWWKRKTKSPHSRTSAISGADCRLQTARFLQGPNPSTLLTDANLTGQSKPFQGDLREGFKVSVVKEKVQEHMCIQQITIP